jgi:mono/diheme cytochrome c family protein
MFNVAAPPLRAVQLLDQHSEAELMARILYGRELAIPIDSQALALTEEEATVLVAYLRRLSIISWPEVRHGQNIYDAFCVNCHGVYGRGDGILAQQLPNPSRDLSSPAFQSQVSEAELLGVIADGRGAMPGMGEIMSPQDLQAVVAFVRLLSPGFERYNRFCAACHGIDGHPESWPSEDAEDDVALEEVPTVAFNQAYFRTHSEAHVHGWVRHMLKSSRALMPHFAGELSSEEIRHILAYLRSLP